MLFHSSSFLIFFAVFFFIFYFVKPGHRIWLTLLASYLFYGWWNPLYLILLIVLSLFAFILARHVSNFSKTAFALCVIGFTIPLCFFKYSLFLWENIPLISNFIKDKPKQLPLPLGISFITFTILAYLIDVRKGRFKISERFENVALYISFFPHLIAGPIMRPNELFPQFSHLKINKKLVKMGLLLFAVGLIKKTIFADSLSRIVDTAYLPTSSSNLIQSLLAFYGFSVQIYCDFSGYTDMALGIAFILGVRLPLNFNRPYQAGSIRDFWKRWHITLSRWLKDYVYISLGGNRGGIKRTMVNLMTTMLLGGLWHGAAWTFVFWGGYHGLLLVLEHSFSRIKNFSFTIPNLLKKIVVFHLVAIGWVFFRAKDPSQIQKIFSGFFSCEGFANLQTTVFPFFLIVIFFLLHRFDRVSLVCWFARRQKEFLVYGIALSLLLIGFVMSVGNPNAFIYFDF